MILVDLYWLDLIQDSKTSKEKFKDEGGRRKVEERGGGRKVEERGREDEGGGEREGGGR